MVYNKNSGGDINPTIGYESLSKFGTKIDYENQRVKFTHLPTRYRVRFIGMGRPEFANNLGLYQVITQKDCRLAMNSNDDLTMDMKEFAIPSGNFANQSIEKSSAE